MFLLRVYNSIKPVKTFCQVFKVEICKANTTVTWQVVIPLPIPRNNLFRGFFMPEYCFLRRYSGTFSLPQNLVKVFKRFWETANFKIPNPFWCDLGHLWPRLLRDIAQIKSTLIELQHICWLLKIRCFYDKV